MIGEKFLEQNPDLANCEAWVLNQPGLPQLRQTRLLIGSMIVPPHNDTLLLLR